MADIPLTVIGGFLGAGKTTLVNHLLHTARRRYGVLVNDFGEVNIDAALIAAQDGDVIALTNGCVCCSLGDDLGAVLNSLAIRTPRPEHLIVEASGVSDPWRIAQVALIEPGFDLQPLIVVVDASALPGQLADRWVAETVRQQLLYAELVVLNKIDVCPDRTAVIEAIRTIRPQARLVEVERGRLEEAWLAFAPPPRPRTSRFAADAPSHPFPTWHWEPSGPLDRDRLRAALLGLPASVLRVKGFIEHGTGGERVLLQYAAERWAFTDADAAAKLGLVVIGTPDMPNAATLRQMFDAAVLAPDATPR